MRDELVKLCIYLKHLKEGTSPSSYGWNNSGKLVLNAIYEEQW